VHLDQALGFEPVFPREPLAGFDLVPRRDALGEPGQQFGVVLGLRAGLHIGPPNM